MTNQDKVVEMVRAGEYTREEILDQVGCTTAGLASYLNSMRNAAKFTPGSVICPIEVPQGDRKVFTVGTYEEFEAKKAERASKPARVSTKTPEQLYTEAEKRVEKAQNAVEKYSAATGKEATLRLAVSKAELALAEFLLAQKDMPEGYGEVDTEDIDESEVVEDELL